MDTGLMVVTLALAFPFMGVWGISVKRLGRKTLAEAFVLILSRLTV